MYLFCCKAAAHIVKEEDTEGRVCVKSLVTVYMKLNHSFIPSSSFSSIHTHTHNTNKKRERERDPPFAYQREEEKGDSAVE